MEKITLENRVEQQTIEEILIDLKRDLGPKTVGEIAEKVRADLGLEKQQIHWSNDCEHMGKTSGYRLSSNYSQ